MPVKELKGGGDYTQHSFIMRDLPNFVRDFYITSRYCKPCSPPKNPLEIDPMYLRMENRDLKFRINTIVS